jgi:hypothetical protein
MSAAFYISGSIILLGTAIAKADITLCLASLFFLIGSVLALFGK